MMLRNTNKNKTSLKLVALISSCLFASLQHTGGDTAPTSGGCTRPVGEKWDRWDMAGSTYAYCYAGCHMPWFINNTARYHLSAYAGVVGVDHYWTGQGVPCIDGEPHEFDNQDKLAIEWKAHFPGMRFLSYRITSAVPYDIIIHNKIVSNPDYFIRWKVNPDNKTRSEQKCSPAGTLGACEAGDVCYNNLSPCFNDLHRINNPVHNCSFEIKAAAYNWLNPDVGPWYTENVIMRSLIHTDGIWLDGNGYDNGAWMCSGFDGGFGPQNSPLNETEIITFKENQASITAAARRQLISEGGYDFNCFRFMVESLPQAHDSPSSCASKLLSTAAWASNHSNYDAVVAYGYDTGAGGYNDSTASGAVAAFMIMRGQHWLFGIAAHNPCNPQHYPVTGRCHSDGCGKPCNATSNQLNPQTAQLLVTDYGAPVAEVEPLPGLQNVFQRRYEKATVRLDCNTFEGSFELT